MRLNSRLTVLHMSVLAALLVPLEAEGEDSDCEIELRVPRGTVYEAFSGEDLRINCTVEFCSDSPPTVIWYKLEEEDVPVNVDSSSHIRTEWRPSNHHEGFSDLIFQTILLSDSGAYQCESEGALSHSINVLVSESGEDSGCELEVKVPRGTVYEAISGEDLRINCTVVFCSDSPPTVTWYKLEEEAVPVNVDSSSHIRTEWRDSDHHEGFSDLIFQTILPSDSGAYQCESEGALSHSINVSVSENNQFECSTVEQTTITTIRVTTSERHEKASFSLKVPKTQETLWPLVYRLVGVLVFVIIVIILCIRPKCGCKGVCCAGRSSDALDPSHKPSDDDSSVIHIYENDQ